MRAIIRNTPHSWSNLIDESLWNASNQPGSLSQQQQILAQWNHTARDYQTGILLHQLIEQQVALTPTAIALTFEDKAVTYQELNAQSNQLAHYLQQAGVGPDVLVGICLERSLEMLTGLLAILKAGGAYVPLDPTSPPERLAWMLEDIQPALLLTQSNLLPLLQEYKIQKLALDTDAALWCQEASHNPASMTNPADLAYVIYTSGSTGQPKGVMVPHRSICNSLQWMQEEFQLTTRDSMLHKTPFVFDASLWELFWPLMTGARIVIARPEGHKDIAYLLALTIKEQITTLFFVPSLLQAFVEEPALTQCQNVRLVLVGGEALTSELMERFLALHPAAFYNLYGPTEAAIEVTCWPCQRTATSRARTIVPIGLPIANTQLYLLDPAGEPVTLGQPGELYIGGENLARGYLNRPDLTAERFIPDPFSHKAEARLYRTGDLARYGTDGRLEYLGRTDQQIKLRGNRIELGEIETVLQSHPSVQTGAVLLCDGPNSDKYLAAYLVTRAGEQLTSDTLRRYLREYLPDYMLPSLFVFLETMPLNTAGKIDRRALPIPDQSQLRTETELMAPQTPLQELLATMWAELLHLPQVSITDNFFELGGHSLLLTQAVSRLRQTLQLEIPLRTLFEYPTIRALATHLEASLQEQQQQLLPILTPRKQAKNVPLSFGQERLWFLDQFAPKNTVCNLPFVRQLSGPLKVNLLAQSLTILLQRHPALRTTFVEQEGYATQRIASSCAIELPVMSLAELSAEEQEQQMRIIAQREAEEPFDLTMGPLIRTRLLRLAEQEHILLFTIHHIVTDGWSMSVLTRDLATIYRSLLNNSVLSLPALPITYADYTLWQREVLQKDLLKEQLDYWQQQLSGVPTMLNLPTDHPRPAIQTYAGARKLQQLSPQLLQALKTLSQQEGVSLFMTLLATFQVLLLRYSGQQDIVVGAPIANRTRHELENLVGLFINTIVLRTDLSGNPSFRQLLGRVREVALQAYAHQDLPFEKLVESLQIERSLSYAPLFQVFFTLQNMPAASFELEGLTERVIEVEQSAAKFDLSLTLTESEAGLQTELEYNTDLFEEATMQRLLGHWQILLEAIIQDVEQPVEQLPLLTPAEAYQLQVRWNATTQATQTTDCLHRLIEQQVERTPEAIALYFEEHQMTYSELNRHANQLAHVLQRSGVGPDVLVGVYMERSLELLIALLGILKAGGAYLPLDPGYPQERLNFMFEDARPALIMTQEHLRASCPATSTTLALNHDWKRFSQEASTNPDSAVTSEHLAYVIYTSGSTGKPKGVMNTHQGICNNFHWKKDAYQLTAQDRILQKTPLSFDVSVWELFLPLVVGASIVIARPEGQKDSVYLIDLIKQRKVTMMEVVPSLLQVLVEEEDFRVCQSLRLVICGGDTLPFELQQRFFACHGAALYNTYGPTEAAIDVTYWVCEQNSTQINIPIGFPIYNTQLYILDTYRNLVPIGVPGEIYIGGKSLARGYHNRPELTAERFIPNHFSSIPGERLYRTGDLACYRTDGAIEYLGRLDQQIKLRGFRIELGEIETILLTHPAVQDAIVLLREEDATQKMLVAYITTHNGRELQGDELRLYLSKKVPAHMIPSNVVMLDALPLTSNGKVDRRALAQIKITRSLHRTGGIAPRNAVEKALATIWMELLKIEQVSISDNFFELGGHSLLAMQLLNRIKQQFGIALPLATLFQVPTIEQEAALLEHKEQGSALIPSPIVTIQSTGSKRPFFCVHPVSGEAYSYLKLAQYLRHDRPFYGLQARGLHSDQVPHTNIEEMAAYYIAELRAVQPEGPYLLGGYSFGGLVAFEMAQQLEAQGCQVDLLAMIDAMPYERDGHGPLSWLPSRYKRRSLSNATGSIRLLDLLKSYTNVTVAALHEQLSQPQPVNQLKYLFGLLIKAVLMPKDTNASQIRRFLRVIKANEKSRRRYRAKAYPGPITLFCHEDKGYNPTAAWEPFAYTSIESYTVPGDHITLITEPHVTALAEQLQRCIDKAEARK